MKKMIKFTKGNTTYELRNGFDNWILFSRTVRIDEFESSIKEDLSINMDSHEVHCNRKGISTNGFGRWYDLCKRIEKLFEIDLLNTLDKEAIFSDDEVGEELTAQTAFLSMNKVVDFEVKPGLYLGDGTYNRLDPSVNLYYLRKGDEIFLAYSTLEKHEEGLEELIEGFPPVNQQSYKKLQIFASMHMFTRVTKFNMRSM